MHQRFGANLSRVGVSLILLLVFLIGVFGLSSCAQQQASPPPAPTPATWSISTGAQIQDVKYYYKQADALTTLWIDVTVKNTAASAVRYTVTATVNDSFTARDAMSAEIKPGASFTYKVMTPYEGPWPDKVHLTVEPF